LLVGWAFTVRTFRRIVWSSVCGETGKCQGNGMRHIGTSWTG